MRGRRCAYKYVFAVDVLTNHPYFGPVMLRQLLTLLAIITGLTATTAPAEARISAPRGAQMQVETQRASIVNAQRPALVRAGHCNIAMRAETLVARPLEIQPPITLTVHIGSDRARQ